MSGYRLPYRSKFEIKVAADLGKRKIAFEYEKVSFDYVPKIRNYTPDFYLPESKIYIETKGRLTTNDRVIIVMSSSIFILFITVQGFLEICTVINTTCSIYMNWFI